ncbi:MAG: substrate-binding domain-containing protein [Firmicutes bacterium]|nr:substrate-binding domain-containing protein [Bacillota bacterium]
MKKLFALFMALCICLFSFAGCSTSPDDGTSKKQSERSESSGTATDHDGKEAKYKIGILYWGYTDPTGASVKKYLEYVGEAFNCELVFAEAFNADALVAATENLIQSGCDGIISVFAYAGMIDACEKAGVYFMQTQNEVIDESTLALIKNSKYFVGMITEDDFKCGYSEAESLYDIGSRNVVYLAPAPGIANHDNRVRGIEAFVEEHPDMVLLSNYRGDEYGEALQNFAVTYPEIDGIILTGGAAGSTETVYQVMETEGLSERGVKLSTAGIGEGTLERFENGQLASIRGGHFPTVGVGFTLLYNALNGDKIISDPTKTLYRPFLEINSAEEFKNFSKYVEGEIPPYTGDELKQLVKEYNPDVTESLYQEWADAYSLEDIIARHGSLIN